MLQLHVLQEVQQLIEEQLEIVVPLQTLEVIEAAQELTETIILLQEE